jgi:hypothetical protein
MGRAGAVNGIGLGSEPGLPTPSQGPSQGPSQAMLALGGCTGLEETGA